MDSPSKPHIIFVRVTRKVIMTSGRLSRRCITRGVIGVVVMTLLVFLVFTKILSTNKHPTTGTQQASWSWIWPQSAHRHRVQGRYIFQHAENKGVVREDWDYDGLMSTISVVPSCMQSAQLLVLVTSAMEHSTERAAIRKTWCSLSSPLAAAFQCVFLLGWSNDQALNARVRQESQQYGDMLIAHYTDTYRNLSLKVLTGLHWAVTRCSHASSDDPLQTSSLYVLKTDDDCFVNTAVLTPFLRIQPLPMSSLYVGMVLGEKNSAVVRNPDSRWDVAKEQYAPAIYPAYTSGAGYILSLEVTQQLLIASRHYRPFPNEDAYIGVLANSINFPPTHSDRFTLLSTKWQVCNMRYLLVLHGVSIERQQELQAMADQSHLQCDIEDDPTSWR